MNDKTWICATCSQGFTRKYGAKRHILNLHSGKANAVRFIDYVIGRLSGEFFPADPMIYRRPKKQSTSTVISHDHSHTLSSAVQKTFKTPFYDNTMYSIGN